MENNTLKSLQGWDNYAKSTNQTNICKYLSIGDIVDEDLVLHFLNISTPTTYYKGYLQVGGAYSDVLDELNKYKPTYLTFALSQGNWVYYGTCFKNETTNRN